MSEDIEKRRYICTPSTPGIRILTFPDGSKSGVAGLEEIFSDACALGKEADDRTAEEMVDALALKNYIPSSGSARREYADVLLKDYAKYIKARIET